MRDESVSPYVTRVAASRRNTEEDVDVEVEVARDNAGMHATTRGVARAVRISEVTGSGDVR